MDNRDGDETNYIAFPDDYTEGDNSSKITIPEFEEVEEEGFDGKRHKYMAVLWQDPGSGYTKKYDVAEHIVIAGCKAKTDGKKMKCKVKELFVVLHPLEEWEKYHNVMLE